MQTYQHGTADTAVCMRRVLSYQCLQRLGSVQNKARPEQAFTAPVEEEVSMISCTAGKVVWLEAAHETILLVNTLSGLCQS